VPPNDADALAAALRQLLENPAQRAAMGAAGRERALHHFSVQVMLEQTLAFYAEAMGRSP
jgi:glycosyltransferase involved in cell wall biosynthesis